MPNKAAKARKRLKRKLALENQTRKRAAYKARREARQEANRDL
jgi:hypothetical protein|tara:strand:- start:38 stop:166 length:129 start_codon:yes stop_codon:yes gene_type:complete